MSVDYTSADFQPNFTFGNSQDVHIAFQQALLKEVTDAVNSNFALINHPDGQIIKTPLQIDPLDGDPDDNTNTNYNNNRVATRKWCKNAFISNVLDPHISSTSYTFTGDHVHSGDVRVQSDPTLANSVTRKSWVDTQVTGAVTTSVNTIRNSANTFTNTNTFTSLPVCSVVPSSGAQLVNKTYADTKQPLITSTTDISMQDLYCRNIQCQAGSISYSEMTIDDGALPQVKVANLVSDLSSKANIADVSSSLLLKQDVITDGSLTIAKTSGLRADLDSRALDVSLNAGLALKQDVITDGSLSIARTSGLRADLDSRALDVSLNAGLALKQDIITDGSLTIAKTNGLRTELDSKVDSTTLTTLLALKQDVGGTTAVNITDVSGLSVALSGKANISDVSLSLLSKQDALTSSSNITVGTVDAQLITANGGITLPLTKTFNMSGNIICNGATINPVELSYIDNATSNIQNQIDSKQNTLTTGSVSDAMLASSFVKTSGNETIAGVKSFTSPPSMSGASISASSIPTSAIASGPLVVTSFTCTSESDSGNGTFGSLSEKITSIGNNGTTNSYTLDYSTYSAVYVLSTAPTANFSVRMNNCSSDTTKTITFAVIYPSTSGYYCNSVTAYTDTTSQITLSSSTPLYSGGTPSISSSTVIIQTFTILRSLASNYCLSSVTPFV